MIRGLVTKESITKVIDTVTGSRERGDNAATTERIFRGTYFVMKLEEGFGKVPDEVLVQTSKFGYFGVNDKVILKGTLFKKELDQWGKPMYFIRAEHFYNESLQIGDEGLMETKQVLYKGTIRGLVTRDSRTRVARNVLWDGTDFVMKLEENIGGVPDEILVRSSEQGYFGKGDKVILQGKITKINLKHWNRLMYVIFAKYFYNESLQIGDEGYFFDRFA